MNEIIRLAGISGSLRKQSLNTAVLNSLSDLLPQDATLDIIGIRDIPFYNGDLDLPLAKERPAAVSEFRRQLAAADGLVIVSPEYNYSIPGVLKNALDWASRGEDSPLLRMPVALIGATPGAWGTVRMQQAFHPFFLYMNMKPVYKPEILIAKGGDKIGENGGINDAQTKKLIREKLAYLCDMIRNEKLMPENISS